jgi:hypothetical protein
MRSITIFAVSILFLILFSSNAHAVNIAMVVKNSASLSYEYEQRIKDILTSMGNNVTLVDKNTPVNYTNYAEIVVVGRPSTEPSYNQLDSFVAGIPVNTVPTIAIDSMYINSWGWATGVSTIFSNQPQTVYITNSTHPITSGYSGTVQVQMATDKVTLGLGKTSTTFKFLAANNEYANLGIIAVREPGTTLSNGTVTKTAAVFFGIPNSLYWTPQTENMFKNAVNWIYDTDKDGVYDVKDLCPNTPSNSTVTPAGCTCAQLGCDDGNPCTIDTCSDTEGCVHTPTTGSCDDGLWCTVNDTCATGICTGIARSCDDGIANSTDSCNEATDACENIIIDTDSDGIYDAIDNCPYISNALQVDSDSDGVGDACDNIFGSVLGLTLQVNGSTDLRNLFTGVNKIVFLDGSKPVVECNFDFTNTTLNLTNVTIERNLNGIGSVAVKGLQCQNTKKIYVDRIANVSYLCIKDAEISSVAEISSNCTGANETLIQCNGTYTNGNYSCSFISQMNKYNVTGLKNSGIKEQPTCNDGIKNGAETGVDCGGSCTACPVSCSDGIQNQDETGVDCGGPCSACPTSGGGGGGSSAQPIGYITIKRSVDVSGLLNTFVLEKNENYTFTVTVKNTGNINLYHVKVSIAGIPSSWVSVDPQSQNIPLNNGGESFDITIIPSDTGIYSASLIVATDEFDAAQNLTQEPFTIKVFDSSLIPILSVDLSPLTLAPGVNNTVSVKINNEGTAGTTGDVSLLIPEGWMISPASQEISVDAQREKAFDFIIAPPSNATGKYSINAVVNYISLDERKTISNSFDMEVKNNMNLAITGFFIGASKNLNNFITFLSGFVRDNFVIFLSTGIATVLVIVGYFSSVFGRRGRKSWSPSAKSIKPAKVSSSKNSVGFFKKLSGFKISKGGKTPWGSTVSGINRWGSSVRYVPEVKSAIRNSPIVSLDNLKRHRR